MFIQTLYSVPGAKITVELEIYYSKAQVTHKGMTPLIYSMSLGGHKACGVSVTVAPDTNVKHVQETGGKSFHGSHKPSQVSLTCLEVVLLNMEIIAS